MTAEDHTQGPVQCEQLGAFVDGELDPGAAAAFRAHLVQCTRCQEEMHGLLQLEALAQDSPPPETKQLLSRAPLVAPRRPAKWRWAMPSVGLALAAAVVAVLVMRQRPPQLPELLASLDARTVSGWPSAMTPQVYRRYDIARGPLPVAPPSLAAAELRAEQTKDWRTLGTLALLRRDFVRADAYLEHLPARPDALADRGLVRLEQGNCEDALEYLDQALRADPHYPPALFNRGLCLRRMDLVAAASSSFGTLAATNLGGWSAEARDQDEDLQRAIRTRQADEEAFRASAQASLDAQDQIPPDLVRRFPGRARARFYRMLALAPGEQELRKVLRAAEALDREFGTRTLAGRVRLALKEVRPERASVAQELKTFYRGSLPTDSARQSLLARALRAGQTEQALQIFDDFDVHASTPERTRLTRMAADPYAEVFLAAATAYQQRGAGHVLEAEQTLRQAAKACSDDSLAVACWYLDVQRAEVERALSRFDSAARIAEASARKMRALGLRGEERSARLEAANVRLAADRVAVARGIFEEIGLREPDACRVTVFRGETLAAGYARRADIIGARSALNALPSCDLEMHPERLELRLDLALLEGQRKELEQLFRLANSRAESRSDSTPENRALAAVIAWRAATELDREGAVTELTNALRLLEGFPSDMEARQARIRGWSTIAFAGLRRGDPSSALRALARMVEAEPENRCTLGVVTDATRQGWVASDAAGRLSQALGVPEAMKSARTPDFSGCKSVAVLTAGRERLESLLPVSAAWSVRVGSKREPTTGANERLLVRDVRPPPELQLAPLGLRQARPGPEWTLLEGPDATPGRVLSALGRVGFAEFEVHGLIDADLPDGAMLVLSEDENHRYALSARELEGVKLAGRPVIMLGACRAAAASTLRDESWTLPRALVDAGARAVFAARVELPDGEVGAFFTGIRERLDSGEDPAAALRDERMSWLKRGRPWVREVLLFD
jgi:tetratricopeptide (TPR) repeat protein